MGHQGLLSVIMGSYGFSMIGQPLKSGSPILYNLCLWNHFQPFFEHFDFFQRFLSIFTCTGHERRNKCHMGWTLGGANDDERIGRGTKGNTFEYDWSSSRLCCKIITFLSAAAHVRVVRTSTVWETLMIKLLISARHKKQNNVEMDFYCSGICSCNDPCWSLVESKF